MLFCPTPEQTEPPLEESPIYVLRNAVVHQVINEVFWRQDVTSFPVEYVSTPIREKVKLLVQ